MRWSRPLIAVLGLAAALAATGAANERSLPPGLAQGPGQAKIVLPEAVSAGTFDGTWMYVNHDARFAMWIRTEEGRARVRLQFQSLATPEAFETDWGGSAKYYMAGHPVTFEMKVLSSDPRKIEGSWFWDAETPTSARKEQAEVVLQRTGFGRTLLMDFRDYAKTVRRGNESGTARVPMAWTWQKVSKREILWDEMPW